MTVSVTPAFSFSYEEARINIYHVNSGEGLAKHDHIYSHATFCMSGSCVVRKEGKEIIINKNTKPLNLVSNEWHEIEALEDGTVFCNIFSEKHNQQLY